MAETTKARSLTSELPAQVNNQVFIQAWLHNTRILGKLAFLTVRDRAGMVQVVVNELDTLEKIKHLQPGSILYITAKVSKTDKTELGVELIDPQFEIVNAVTEAWPVEINKPELNVNLDTLLENRALTLRHPKQAAIFKIQGVMAQAYREFMVSRGFSEFFGPAMLASSSEGGAEVFKLDYFGNAEATLAQSNQLYKQMMVGVYERVFGMAKWFRAENSNTRRHLTEGSQYEFEMGFIKDSHDVMDVLDEVIRYMLAAVREKCGEQLKLLGVDLVTTPAEQKIPRYKFSDAVKIYQERSGADTTGWKDLDPDSERELCQYAREKYGSDFIFVTNIPKGAFYAYKDETGTYHNFDLLCREAEIVSGGRRIDNYDKLVEAIKTAGMDPSAFSEYLSIFKYGMPPHGGFGLGFERFTMMALGLENIREASLFPSDTKRIASQKLPEKRVRGAGSIKKAIKQLFVDRDLEFQVLKHEPTPTSEDAAKVRGMSMDTGVKALILRDKKTGDNVLVAIPASKKLDIKAATVAYAELSGVNAKLEFEKPEVIEERYGLVVGGVPPFGEIFGIKTLIDAEVFTKTAAAFNNADLSESLLCQGQDLKTVLAGKLGKFTVE